MRKPLTVSMVLASLAPVFFIVGCMVGRQAAQPEKALMHVFAYTPPDGVTQEDFEKFRQATAGMVGAIPGLRRVWVGKLRQPIPAENDVIRTYGVAMEFDDVQALNVYAGHSVHKDWEKVYQRVRVQGSTTLDILSE